MPPNQGAGTGQAMEDAFVVAEVLGHVDRHNPKPAHIHAALKAYEAVWMPRAQRALETRLEAMDFWSDFYSEDLVEEDLQCFAESAKARFQWLWYDDIADQGERACKMMQELLCDRMI